MSGSVSDSELDEIPTGAFGMKKAYNSSEELCHSELDSESQKTLKQVQGDELKVRGNRAQLQNTTLKAFTLAEIMIVLSVIAVLTAVLLPAAQNAMPNEDLMKFKKAHLILVNVISELVNSDKYYYNGDLSIKPNGQKVDSATYFCNTFADVVGNVKSLNCKDRALPPDDAGYAVGFHINLDWVSATENRGVADNACKTEQEDKDEIILADGTSFYTLTPGNYFGHPASNQYEWYKTQEGFYYLYRVLCMDIDGTPENATETNCVNECPFGYGLRIDGKLYMGLRASEWFKKSIQEKD